MGAANAPPGRVQHSSALQRGNGVHSRPVPDVARLPDVVLLDFFGTLVELDHGVPTMAELLTSHSYECSREMESVWNSWGFDGHLTPAGPAYARWREQMIWRLVEAAGVPAHERDRYVRLLLENDRAWTVKAAAGSSALISLLRDLRIPHVISTNWDYPVPPYLEQAGLPTDIPVVTSADCGARKPAAQAFLAALDHVGAKPSKDVWHVGDSWAADVVGALRAGLRPVYLSPSTPMGSMGGVDSVETLEGVVQLLRGAHPTEIGEVVPPDVSGRGRPLVV